MLHPICTICIVYYSSYSFSLRILPYYSIHIPASS